MIDQIGDPLNDLLPGPKGSGTGSVLRTVSKKVQEGPGDALNR